MKEQKIIIVKTICICVILLAAHLVNILIVKEEISSTKVYMFKIVSPYIFVILLGIVFGSTFNNFNLLKIIINMVILLSVIITLLLPEVHLSFYNIDFTFQLMLLLSLIYIINNYIDLKSKKI